jgi:hypothetical protein
MLLELQLPSAKASKRILTTIGIFKVVYLFEFPQFLSHILSLDVAVHSVTTCHCQMSVQLLKCRPRDVFASYHREYASM